ncbi:MAG: helix-turn-helix domain-containing protein [Solirubrobacterales bacterium]
MSRYEEQQAPGIGATLKEARRRLRMDIKEAEERTKIRTRYLRALEAEDWEVLPAPAYVRGFLRTYGQILGLDGEALADRYRRTQEEPATAAPPEPVLRNRHSPGGSRPPSRGGLIAAIAAAIVVLVAVLAAIGLTSGDDEPDQPKRPGKAKEAKRIKNPPKPDSKPIDIKVEPLASTRICLVGGGEALIDSQVLTAGATEKFGGESKYRLDLIGGGSVRVQAGADEQKLEPGGNASYEADSRGIEEIDFAGPDCP